LSWNIVSFTEVQNTSSDLASPTKKKRKKRNSLAEGDDVERNGTEVVILGLSDGTVLFFSPIHGRILRTLSHPTSTAEILSVVVVENRDTSSTIWTSGADGTIRLWNAQKNDILGSWKTEDRTPYSAMAVRTLEEEGRIDVLTAHHGIRLLSTTSDYTDFDTKRPINLGSFTGHASSIRNLQWDASQVPSTRFLSLAEADRFLYIWEATEGPSAEGRPIASIPLDSDARNFSLSISHRSPDKSERQTLLTLSASGKISIYPIPQELPPPASTVRTQHIISTLLPRSTLNVSSKLAASPSKVIDAAFSIEDKDSIRIARIVGGVQPVFDVVVCDLCSHFSTQLMNHNLEIPGTIRRVH
jgi:U3 small nucleolar RNA-associated protein 5